MTKEHEGFIRENAGRMKQKEMARAMGVSPATVHRRMRKLGLVTYRSIPYRDRIVARSARTSNGCWEWTGPRNAQGYGTIKWGHRAMTAHRAAWRAFRGPMPAGAFVCHHCDNPPCVNPDHLYLGDHATNMRDVRRRGRASNRNAILARARLTPEAVREIRARYALGGILQCELADAYGVTPMTIHRVVRGLSWRFVA